MMGRLPVYFPTPQSPRCSPSLLLRGDGASGSVELLLVVRREAALAEFDHGLLEFAGELERREVVLVDGRAGVLSAVQRLVEREAERQRALDAADGHRLAVCLDRG